MKVFVSDSTSVGRFPDWMRSRLAMTAACSLLSLAAAMPSAQAQSVDCGRLQQQIAQGDRGSGRGGNGLRRQQAEIARTQAAIAQLGCSGGGWFSGGDPRCGSLTQRLAGLQAGLQQLEAQGGGGGGRPDLVARYNAYCRGGQPAPQQQSRGFFDSLFSGFQQQQAPPPPPAELPKVLDDDEGGSHARGGSQAVCVRTCDGGFFPLALSARHSDSDLTEMCQALCPGTDTAVYTRNPDSDIKTAASLAGKPYMDLPNALHFQKAFTAACSCRPAGKSWSETLANAEEVLDSTRKGDIVVTPEKSAEMSRPKIDPKAPLAAEKANASAAAPPKATTGTADASKPDPADGSKRAVRQVGPQL